MFDKPKPKPESKVKQKQTSQTKSFIKQLPDIKKKRGGFVGAEDQSSELSDTEYRWVAGMYGNIVDGSDTESNY